MTKIYNLHKNTKNYAISLEIIKNNYKLKILKN